MAENQWIAQATQGAKEPEKTYKIPKFETMETASQKRGIKCGVFGNTSTGKTHFALTATAPILIIDTEMGSPLLKESFIGKDIKVLSLTNEESSNMWLNFENAVEYCCREAEIGNIKTIIIDSFTDIWDSCQEYVKNEIFKIRDIDKPKQQWDWGTISKPYKKQLLKLINAKCDVILVTRAGEEYISAGKPLGIFKPRWQKDTIFLLDYLIEMKMNKQTKTFYGTIQKSRTRGKELIGITINDINWEMFQKTIGAKTQ